MNGSAIVELTAKLTLALALLPASFFVGRSVWWHLIHNWHIDLGPWGLLPAVIAGIVVELVGILSAQVVLACARWNRRGHVRKEKSPWERAPIALAGICFGVYVVSAIALTVVLEAWPDMATAAPALFTVVAATAYFSVGIYEQHRDRLTYYGLTWNWKTTRNEGQEDKPADVPDAQLSVPSISWTESELDDLDRDILRTLQNRPEASYRTVAKMVGSAKTTVAGRTERLVQNGLMTRTGQGWSVQWQDNGNQEYEETR